MPLQITDITVLGYESMPNAIRLTRKDASNMGRGRYGVMTVNAVRITGTGFATPLIADASLLPAGGMSSYDGQVIEAHVSSSTEALLWLAIYESGGPGGGGPGGGGPGGEGGEEKVSEVTTFAAELTISVMTGGSGPTVSHTVNVANVQAPPPIE